jgi:hypothetical protein
MLSFMRHKTLTDAKETSAWFLPNTPLPLVKLESVQSNSII